MHANRLNRVLDAIGTTDQANSATYPQRVCGAAVGLLGVTGSGLTLMTDLELGAVWASDATAQAIEDLQFALGEGPALDAFRKGAPALEPDLPSASCRWPFFCSQAVALGTRAVFSFPLQVGVIRLGSLNLFRNTLGFPTKDQLADALVLADVATQDLIDLQAEGSIRWSHSDRLGQRTRVQQATGMVAAQIDSDMASALARLRAHAFANDITIFEVAEQVVARSLRLAGAS